MKAKTVFYCTECGNETPKWQGRCPACGAWNTVVERPAEQIPRKGGPARGTSGIGVPLSRPKSMEEVEVTDELRFRTGMGELDRVLGGGAVRGSLVLVGGAPGIGKSTLMLQICDNLCRFAKVLYVSGEESERQIKLRAQRLNVAGEELYLLSETNLEHVLDAVHSLQPDVLIVDSIQTLYHGDISSGPGSISQVKECTMSLMQLAKGEGITVFVIGHVNKEGSIAGPKVLEHMVDCVLYFEGERQMAYRILRAAKNRFGATNEIGVFEMADAGLTEVPNPSEALLAGRPTDAPGTCVTCVMEGVRPVLELNGLLALRAQAGQVYVSDEVLDYIVRLVGATRSHPMILQGASPRATLALTAMAKAAALVRGRDYVLPEDVSLVFGDVVPHRLLLSPRAEADRSFDPASELLERVPAPRIS